ncbi:MAG: hypothetical protein LBU51_05005 [Bacteroidales bacterium]|nr:hypothetical protein [Bacteroidales bacterium]
MNKTHSADGVLALPDNLNAHAQVFQAMVPADPANPVVPVVPLTLAAPGLATVHAQTPNRWDIEESVMRNLFLQNKTTTSVKVLSDFDGLHKTAFRDVTNGLFQTQMPAVANLVNDTSATNASRIAFFNGLLGVLPIANLQLFWDVLADIKNVVYPVTNEAVLNEITHMSGLACELHNVTPETYGSDVHAIAREIAAHRMVIVLFRDPKNTNCSHACVAYQANGQNLTGALDAEGGPCNTVDIYNPWGFYFTIYNGNDSTPRWDINSGNVGNNTGPMNWDMYQYITFTY